MQVHKGEEQEAAFPYPADDGMGFGGRLLVGDGDGPLIAEFLGDLAEAVDGEFLGVLAPEGVDAAADLGEGVHRIKLLKNFFRGHLGTGADIGFSWIKPSPPAPLPQGEGGSWQGRFHPHPGLAPSRGKGMAGTPSLALPRPGRRDCRRPQPGLAPSRGKGLPAAVGPFQPARGRATTRVAPTGRGLVVGTGRLQVFVFILMTVGRCYPGCQGGNN